ncbi:carboxylesterase/lipase family protein [Schaalia sp. JY-X159]|uniref:carboxylesterase/lipase family protein n=1 Tax=Schaalia sp. JY-X159 TaxID=2758575 RepID=UPI00165E702F|nr:carboxylesterase family protein [Schaalia sp. JY-X159]
MTNGELFVYADAHPPCGPVRGFWRQNEGADSAAFLGIPFAQPPVGSLRFAEPQPVAPWSEIREALHYGATAQRTDSEDSLIPEPALPGDSTLNVNVFTPAPGDDSASLPVMVWIHGGGFTAGSPASPWYDGQSFNRDGVVTVTISYRLGFLGFGWVEGAPQNRGILDWLAALRWVQNNIAAFGGDPGNVTIAGQSAGGGAVLTLLGMESAQSLFHRAISVSGALVDIPEADARATAKKIGAALDVPASREALDAVPESAIEEAQSKIGGASIAELRKIVNGGLPFGPVIDGTLLKRPTLESMALGVGSGKHLLIGATDDEFTMIFEGQKKLMRWVPRSVLRQLVGAPGGTFAAYARANADVVARGNADLMGRYLTDSLFRVPLLRVAMVRGGAQTWVYQYSFRQPTTGLAGHCSDVPFWFDCLDAPRVAKLLGDHPSQELATTMHQAAVRIIEQGDPGWPRWDNADGQVMVFDGDPLEAVKAGGFDEVRPLMR